MTVFAGAGFGGGVGIHEGPSEPLEFFFELPRPGENAYEILSARDQNDNLLPFDSECGFFKALIAPELFPGPFGFLA